MRSCLLWAALGAAFFAAAPAHAQPKTTPHPVFSGYERFFADEKADPVAGGQLLLTELNCVNCHAVEGGSAFLQRQGPTLTDVGARIKRSFIKKFITDPHAVKPGTAMPNVLAGLPEEERKDAIEALTHYLASTGTPKQERPDGKQVGMGGDLYAKAGCVICHGARDGSGKMVAMIATHAPKVDLKSKYTIATLAAFLENPHQARPSGRMPGLLDGKEAKAVANYLLQGIAFVGAPIPTTKGTTSYSLYEGDFGANLPDFSKLKAKKTGVGTAFDLGASPSRSNYGMVFSGVFQADQDGLYTFHLASDDGSRLLIDGKKVIDNDGVHPKQAKSGSAKLKKGIHKVEMQYFQGAGEDELEIEWEGPTISRQDFAGWVAATDEGLKKKPATEAPVAKNDEENYPLDAKLAAKGKSLFGSLGCVNCHTAKDAEKAKPATPLAKLKAEGGCLANEPTKGIPFFGLSAQQKTSLVAAIKANASLKPANEKESIARTLAVFNCVACHVRDKTGGVEDALNKHFVTTQPEMGDEARLPPVLDGVGAKMNPGYLDKILDKGVRDRTYMLVRMPRFGAANVGHLSKDFRAIDKIETAPKVEYATTMPKVKSAGRHMVGAQAFGCIKCHTFAGKKAEGTQGIDMTVMAQRVTRDWFHAYLLDPNKIRPGTRMPAAWPKGEVFLANILDGKAATQIDAIYQYLADGASAQIPVGMNKASIPLMPVSSAIIYRNFIEGAGARAIGVGFPERANLAFDANDLRMAMVWQGAFIDAARHWTDRGVGYEPPLGDNVIKLPPSSAFARLESGTAAWPTKSAKEIGGKFKGYRLDKEDRPTFLYAFGDVSIEDSPSAAPEKDAVHIRRTLSFSSEKDVSDLYFRVAAGNKIESLGNGWYRINGDWRVKLEGGEPQIRSAGNGSELIVRVPLQGGKARLIEEFGW
jgi:mono/diheme cytochrome c family protein